MRPIHLVYASALAGCVRGVLLGAQYSAIWSIAYACLGSAAGAFACVAGLLTCAFCHGFVVGALGLK